MDFTVLFFFVAAIAIYIVITMVSRVKRNAAYRQQIRSSWGKIPQHKIKQSDFESIACYYRNKGKIDKHAFCIDDITWDDLDMNRVFERINSTSSVVGEEYLYNLLRELKFDSSELVKRQQLIELFQKNTDKREQLQLHFAKMGKQPYLNIFEYLNGNRSTYRKSAALYYILLAIFLISPVITLFTPIGGILLIASLLTNIGVYFKTRNEIVGHLESLGYIVGMANIARKAARIDFPEIQEYLDDLKASVSSIKGISFNAFFSIFYTTENYFLEMIKVIFLGEPIAFYRLFNLLKKHSVELTRIYEIVGYLDSLMAIASYRESIGSYCTPELTLGARTISFKNLKHPLINECVENSLTTQKSIIITGSNASGKSTFLKALGINAVFAQTICTCHADSYSSGYFKVYSSMALKDNLEMKESYYIVEIKSLKRILEAFDDETPCLCIIDEVLRGTNTIERIAASSEIINYFAKANCICICATHDLELTRILDGAVENYHFQEYFNQNEIKFDYKLYDGPSNTKNAINLLKILGYSDKIVTNATKRAQSFEAEGYWDKIYT